MPFWLQKTLYFVFRTLLLVLVLFLALKLLRYLAPFIVAFLLANALEPVVQFLEKRIRLPRKLGAVFSLLFVLGAIGTLLGMMGARLAYEIRNVYAGVSGSSTDFADFLRQMMEKAQNFYFRLPEEVTQAIDSTASALGESVRTLLGRMAQSTLAFTVSIPEAVVFLLVSILAAYFMISDRKPILEAFERWVPHNWLRGTRRMLVGVFKALFGWLRAQGIIICITFTVIVSGLLLAGVANPLIIALSTAVIDALPVFGAGAVLIPWGIFSLATGNVKLGVFLLLLDVVILVLRHLIEPRIVGRQIGIHPLLTLVGMYLGLQWIGVLGMIAGPILMVVLRAVLEGVLKLDSVKAFLAQLFRSNGGGGREGGFDSDGRREDGDKQETPSAEDHKTA